MLSTVWIPQRCSRSYIEKTRGRRETEVARRIKGGIKKRETDPASNLFPTKVRLVKAMVFPVVMYGCESWTVKKAERWRIDAFEPWCWRRLLRVPWAARRSNQSILKEISPGISLEGMMLKLKVQYFGHLMRRGEELTHWKRLWCWEGLGAGGEGDHRGWDVWRASPTRWMWVWLNSESWRWTGRPGVCDSWGCKESDTTEWLNWTEVFSTAWNTQRDSQSSVEKEKGERRDRSDLVERK